MSARVGIVLFPGSCDEHDAFLAVERAGLEPDPPTRFRGGFVYAQTYTARTRPGRTP